MTGRVGEGLVQGVGVRVQVWQTGWAGSWTGNGRMAVPKVGREAIGYRL